MNRPPTERIEMLRSKLRSGEQLSVGDRLVALWFVNESEGWPQVDPTQADEMDKAMEAFLNRPRNPDGDLKEPVWSVADTFSAFTVIKEMFFPHLLTEREKAQLAQRDRKSTEA